MADHKPPFYVLLAHSTLSNLPAGAPSNTLGHPVIQYHYSDDAPLSLLPNQPGEHVLVLNYDPQSAPPTVQSISDNVVVTGLRLEEAPGAAADESGVQRNDTMFIIETTGNDNAMSASQGDRKSAQAILSHFKHRNAILRRALDYPANVEDNLASPDTSAQPLSATA
ncbi:hypothetical protein NLJ89_g7593 [Agrocybe chaxingu]|uniref:Uncharacterized protein n=1 Tax=Agrocybe chaxingu TaxID=84603 RepID=A0A9W8JX14_9AGAR|nr:hypothetical protein NLJ89_g7593 [Agrocybe chaxingu]